MSENNGNAEKLFENELIKKYTEIIRLIPNLRTTAQPVTNLKQPSLLKKVDSVTKYGVSER